VAKKRKLNGALLTDEEKSSPMGLGYVGAAERLNLIYLASPEAMLNLLLEFGNEAYQFSQCGGMSKRQFWKTMNEKAERLAVILQGKNPAYMAIPWFTDPNQLAAHLRCYWEDVCKDDPPEPFWKQWQKHPVRVTARAYMEFFLEILEGGIEGQGKIPDIQLMTEHIRKHAGLFLGLDPAMLQLNLEITKKPKEPLCG
jgi:hypothetical protein